MSAASEEKKSSVPSSHVTLKVNTQRGYCFVLIKKDVELRLLMEAVSFEVGVEMSTLRFLYDGKRIRAHQTPNELELEDDFVIDALSIQGGGDGAAHRH
ncbi:unnamed protein product [Microthlaspi erraticum]|uniref:Ubiquitin-like domain-containing protein n=1 Tax=Microthlaspi erraticum TaxID=1685480 RepID=A0A6D2LDA3_9BRAS|nr:unnamed protein product [Microthlaspi erraticum]